MKGENVFCVSWAPCGIVALTENEFVMIAPESIKSFYTCSSMQKTLDKTRTLDESTSFYLHILEHMCSETNRYNE